MQEFITTRDVTPDECPWLPGTINQGSLLAETADQSEAGDGFTTCTWPSVYYPFNMPDDSLLPTE